MMSFGDRERRGYCIAATITWIFKSGSGMLGILLEYILCRVTFIFKETFKTALETRLQNNDRRKGFSEYLKLLKIKFKPSEWDSDSIKVSTSSWRFQQY